MVRRVVEKTRVAVDLVIRLIGLVIRFTVRVIVGK